MSKLLVQMNKISKSFGGVQALKEVDFTLGYGEIHCLAGENGCGKSTLIKVLSGVHSPDSGDISIDGTKFKNITPIEAINQGIQVIYQDFSVFPNLSVAENVALNSELADNTKLINWNKIKKRAKQALKRINVDIDLSAKVETLTVADKQLIAIARALMHKAKLIVMDEPTTALTQKEVKTLFKIITDLKQEGISTLFVSHKLEEVFEISEKVTILRNGKNVVTEEVSKLDQEKLIYYMTGRTLNKSYYEMEVKRENPILKTKTLSLNGRFKDVNLEVYKGEIVGLTGLLGSGRTDLAEALFGIHPASSGEIHINGKNIKISSPKDAIKCNIAYVPEDRLTEGLFLEQSISENIIISVIDELTNKMGFLDRNKINESIDDWVKKLGIVAHSTSAPVKTLSGGNQQRVVLAKWLLTNPDILILNGPSVGVDVGSKEDIHQIIRELAKNGVGILLISDDLEEIRQNCNRVYVMGKGRIIGETIGKDFSQEKLNHIHEVHELSLMG